MNQRHLWISIVAVLVGGLFLFQDALAKLAWQRFNRPDIAVLLVRRDAEFAMLLGNYYFGATLGKSEYDLAKAERAFSKAVAAKPGILWGHYQLARIHFLRGKLDAALEEINRELEANPENLRSLYVRGLIYGYRAQVGDLENAEADFRRFTQWAPKEWAGYNDLAWILSKAGKYREAKETIEGAFREMPTEKDKNPWLWNALGLAELNLREYVEARAAFEKAKTLAEALTLADWQRSYPGNSPDQAASGLEVFRRAISENLRISSNQTRE